MDNIFKDDYNLNNLKKIYLKTHGFYLFATPRFLNHYAFKPYEQTTASIISRRIKNVRNFIDVGAHYGFYSILVGKINPQINILAFEPVPENFEILKKNIEFNGIKNVFLFQEALSNEEGIFKFQISEASDNSGFIANPAVQVLREIDVKVTQLDQHFEKIGNRPSLVKIDTEGSEPRVLQGMSNVIERVDDLELIIEFNVKCLRCNGYNPTSLLHMINDLGFSIFFIHEEEGECQKFKEGLDWEELMGAENYKNLYCVKKKILDKKRYDFDVSILKDDRKKVPTNKSKIQKILLVNHNLFPFEISGTPISTLNHALGLSQRGIEVGVLIPSIKVKEGFSKESTKDFTLYRIPALEKYEAFLAGPEDTDPKLSRYRSIINDIIDDFLPQTVQINDYLYMPAEIIEIFSKRGCLIIRNVCNMEEICHQDYPVISSGLGCELCVGPEDPKKCAICLMESFKKFSQNNYVGNSFKDIEKRIENRITYIKELYLNMIDKVVFSTEQFKNYFSSFIPLPENKIKIIPRGFKFDFERNNIQKKKLNDIIHFGFVGNIMNAKGIDVTLKAFKKLCETYDFVFHLFGEVIDKDYFYLINEWQNKYPDKFKYHGGFLKSDLPHIANIIDIGIVTSYFDTYNRVIRELIYMGIPVITTDFFGASIIKEGKNGLKIPVGDFEKLGEEMKKIILNPQIVRDLAQGAENTKIPTLDEEIDQLIQVNDELLCNPPLKKRFGKNNPKLPLENQKMTHKKIRLIAFYLPQFHPIPENDQWWGKGFTEWTNVTKAKPLFEGHYQPHLPADLGFYDLRLPEVREAQANLAREYGIYGFCYYHYWFKGKRLLERPFDEVLRSGKPDFPFCLCWANENWTRAWDGQENEVLQKQEYSEEDDLLHIHWLAQAFKDRRYIRINGKPLFLIYRAGLLPNPKRTIEIWRDEAKRIGIGEIYLCRVESTDKERDDPTKDGFDASVEFQPDWVNLGERLLDHPVYERHLVYRYEDIVERMLKKEEISYKRYPCVTPSWDNSARRKSGACIFIESNPEIYERWLKKVLKKFKPPTPDENIVFINAWNEWAEGNHLEPDQRFGRGYLEATRRALWITSSMPDSFSSEDIYKDCLSLIKQNRKEEAIAGLKKLISYDPFHASAHNDLGVLYYEKKEIEQARWFLERAIELAPDELEFKENLANLYIESNHFEKAMELYKQVLNRRPEDADVHIKMAHCYFQLGQEEDGFGYIKKVLDVDPENTSVKEYLSHLFDFEGRKDDCDKNIRKEEKKPKISIVIPVFNQLKLIQKCLKSILQFTNDINYEIIVVDDASADGTTEFLKQIENNPLLKIILKEEHSGFIEACNSGAKIASGEYLLFLSPHTQVHSGWVTPLLQLAESLPDCGAVSSKLIGSDERFQKNEPLDFSNTPEKGEIPEGPDCEISSIFVKEIDYCSGAFLLVRKNLWEEIKGFNQRYYPAYYEDTDFFLELKKRGWKVYSYLSGNQLFCDNRSLNHKKTPGTYCNSKEIKEQSERYFYSNKSHKIKNFVSIIIPVLNQLEYTKNCLASIFKHTDIPFELIIVDNGSIDGTGEYLRQKSMTIKNLTYLLLEENKGFGVACNLGAKMSKGKYLVFLNNDTEVTPGWLNSLISFMESHPECGAVGVKLVYPDGRLQEAGGIIFSDGTGWNYGRGMNPSDPCFNFVREVDYCSGAALMVRKDLWDEIGGFDLRYAPAYYEDTDLCFEIRKRGYKVYYQPKSTVIHHEGRTAGTDLQSGYKKFQEINRAKFIEKWRNELKNQYINNSRNVVKASDRQVNKNILVIDHALPFYDRASGYHRLFQILKILKKMKFHITFLAREGSLENQYRPILEDMGIEVYPGDYEAMKAAGYKENPWPIIQYNSLFQFRSYDFALIEFWWIANYYVPIIKRLSPQTKIIIDSVDIHFVREIREAELKRSPELKKKALLNKEKEITTYKQGDRIWVVTETDKNAISSILKDKPIDVIPNIHEKVEYKKSFEESSGLLFVGNFNHLPNRDAIHFFCKDIFPFILNKMPAIKLYIVGDNTPEDIKALSSPQVIVTGYVPDLTPYLKMARISVNPLRYGAGMKGKIGEALSWGLPVVTTSIGAEGMGLIDGQEAMIADSPEEFAQKVIQLYQDPIIWRRLSENGKKKMEANWTPEAICKRLEEVFQQKKLEIGQNLVSILILTHNQMEYTKKCLESIFQHTDIPFELIIVDNGSKDGTPEYLKEIIQGKQLIAGRSFLVKENGEVVGKWSGSKKKKKKNKVKKDFFCQRFKVVFNEKNLGFAAGNNHGMAEAKGEYILIMNNDVVVTPGWLKRMLAVAERKTEIGIVGPMSNYVSGPQLLKEIKYNPNNLNGLIQFAVEYMEKNYGQARPIWRVVGFCMLIKRDVVEKIGGFDERYGLGNFEDDDFSLRARIAGFESWIAEDCFVHHFGSRTFLGEGIDYSESLKKNWEMFKRKWGIPKEIEYGVNYDLGWILKQAFNPTKHYFPITPDRLSISQAEDLFNLGDLDGAKTLFEKMLFYDPKNIEALNDLGVIYFHQGEIDQAISYFYKVLELNEEHAEALENLGNCMVAQGRFREAIPWFNKVLNFKPKDVGLLNSLANCFIQLEEFTKAKEIYEKSYQIDKNQVYIVEVIKELDKMKELGNQRSMIT